MLKELVFEARMERLESLGLKIDDLKRLITRKIDSVYRDYFDWEAWEYIGERDYVILNTYSEVMNFIIEHIFQNQYQSKETISFIEELVYNTIEDEYTNGGY